MTSSETRMRPEHPSPRRVADLAAAFSLETRDGAPIPPDLDVTGVTVASSEAEPGDLFVALRGLKAHGARFAPAAVAAGAVAVLTDAEGAQACADLGVPVLVAPAPRDVVGEVAAWGLGDPARGIVTVGVTGTNGKTTTTYFVDAALRAHHRATAVLGTVELRIGDLAIESP